MVDKVRVAGIIFQDDMRSYIQNMVGTSRGSRMHAVLDAPPGRKLYAMNRLHEQFIDSEIVIQIPPDWNVIANQKEAETNQYLGGFTRQPGG
jgi:hypothetical protein